MRAPRPQGGDLSPLIVPAISFLAGIVLAPVVVVSCAPMSRWPPPPMPFPPRPGQPYVGPYQLGLDATPEDYAVEKLVSLIQQVGREKDRMRSQKKTEEDSYVDVVSYDEDDASPQVATKGQGPGFTYQFPPGEQRSIFAVNPSDPLYYSAPDGIRSEAMNEKQEDTREGMAEREETPVLPPVGRFPEVKPIKVTTDIELPPDAFPPEHHEQIPHPHEIRRHEEHTPSDDVKKERPVMSPVAAKYYVYLTAVIAGCSAAGIVGVIAVGIFWYKLQRNAKAAADVEYPAYGVTGPNQEASAVAAAAAAASVPPPSGPTGGSTSPLSAGDRRLAQSAQMYHYQHQKQQIIAMESRASNERHGSVSEVDSEEENEEGDYTVYECPGLAPTGEMEVKNPLFHDDPTPATPSGGIREQRDAGAKQ